MSHTIVVEHSNQSITITNLLVKNPDFFGLLADEAPTSQSQIVLDIIAAGSAAMRRVRTTVDVDFVESRFKTLTAQFDKGLTSLEQRATDALSKRFSPTESGSYTKQIGELIAEAKRSVQEWNKEANNLLDPQKKTSGVARLDEIIQQANTRFHQMFDVNVRTSFAYQLHEQLSRMFGAEGHAGVLQSALQEALKPVFAELHEVKERIEARKAAELIVESSTLKGRPFEELVEAELSRLAQPYGDEIENVSTGSNGSRAGDFIVRFNGMGKTAVVEARNRKQMGVPAIKTEMDRELRERSADLAIYVSSAAEMLPQYVGGFQVYDNKMITTADNLHIAYRLARLLLALETPDGSIDVGNLRSVLSKIKDATKSLRNIKNKATQVRTFADGITADANGTEDIILNLIADAEKLLEPPIPAPSARNNGSTDNLVA